MIMHDYKNLKVALLAGTLGQGGAEKQLVFMVHALLEVGVNVRVYSLTKGEYYEPILQSLGVYPQWIGKHSNPIIRLRALMVSLRNFRPHVLQSAHFYANLYVSAVSHIYNTVSIGSIRNDMVHEMESNPVWGKLLLSGVGSLIANSQMACQNAIRLGIASENLYYLSNVIDLADFDRRFAQAENNHLYLSVAPRILIASVGRLVPAKRFDRFIKALAIARRNAPELLGIIIGDGPEKENLYAFAQKQGLSDEDIIFLGRRNDVPAILKQAHIFILTSDHEGFPNVLLEAMAARLPVITTPAGDSSHVVQNGLTGYVVPFNDMDGLVKYMLLLAESAQLRNKLGQTGRMRVEQNYGSDGLAENLISIYKQIAVKRNSEYLRKVLSN